MFETRYRVLDDHNIVLADNMTLEMTMAFIKGYREMFYQEELTLIVQEMPKPMLEDENHNE